MHIVWKAAIERFAREKRTFTIPNSKRIQREWVSVGGDPNNSVWQQYK